MASGERQEGGGEELSHSILLGQDRIVELLAHGVAASEVFSEICEVAARRFGGVRCAILAPDPKRPQLAVLAASGVPEELVEALGALELTSAEAIFPVLSGPEPQVVESIARDPRWAQLAPLVARAGLDAAWSVGIRSPGLRSEQPAEGLVLFLLPGARRPSPRGVRVLEMLARLAGLALERERLTRDRDQEQSIDPLTKLPNRLLFDRLLADLIELASPDHTRFALVLVDLDRFVEVNRDFGFRTGDLMLSSFARRLRHALREGDLVTRLDGDCFALLVRLEGAADEVQRFAERLLGVVRKGFEFSGETVPASASVGLALYPWDGVDAAALLGHAELALRAAQSRGGDRAIFFSPTLAAPPRPTATPATAAKKSATTATEEPGAPERFRVAELELLWEPVVELSTRRLAAFTAVATIPHADGERVAGADLWRLAARGGALAAANRWWAKKALEQAASWLDSAPAELLVSLPLAVPQLADGALIGTLLDLLAVHRQIAGRIEVVLPALTAPRDFDLAHDLLAGLFVAGARRALGEVGSAPLPLDLLLERPALRWRLDPGLVRAAPRSSDSGDLLAGLVALAHRLGVRVEAAGVESFRDLSWLLAQHCDWGSGHALRPPLGLMQLRIALLESAAK